MAAGLCAVVGGVSVAGAAGSPAGGPIQVFVQPGNGQGNGKILITGGVGDFGSTHKEVSGDKTYAVAELRRGTIEFDLTTITADANNASPTANEDTCSASFSVTAPVPIISGTGRYLHATGTVNLTESFGFLGSKIESGAKKGQCDMSDSAQPIAQMGVVYGSGTISF